MINAALRVAGDVLNRISHPGSLPVVYFAKVPNVGDLLNPYLLPKLSGKPICRVESAVLAHVRAIGSVLGSASNRSYIWGSGSIDGRVPVKGIDPNKVYALRGKKTWHMLNQAVGLPAQMPLGDPAILTPDFYDPAIEPKYLCGIVPHFSDLPLVRELASDMAGIKIIDVRQEPEPFINEIKCCRSIISSSLHGLILADSYGIPNIWASFSSQLLGGEWKFKDYFSVTDGPESSPVAIDSRESLERAVSGIDRSATVRSYLQPKEALYEAFAKLCGDF